MENKHLSIVGYGKNRAEADFYPTPESTTKALMEREKFEGDIYECACGDGSMSEVLKTYNPEVFSADIIGRGYGYKQDFLKAIVKHNNIITNPPYRYAKEFVLKAKELATKKVAMLLKLVFLEGIGRYEMFQDKEFPFHPMFLAHQRLANFQQIHQNIRLVLRL